MGSGSRMVELVEPLPPLAKLATHHLRHRYMLAVVHHRCSGADSMQQGRSLRPDQARCRHITSVRFSVHRHKTTHIQYRASWAALHTLTQGCHSHGIPLLLITQPCNATLLQSDTRSIAVLQSLADHDPDVDGIFRLTRSVPFSFNPNSNRTITVYRGSLAH